MTKPTSPLSAILAKSKRPVRDNLKTLIFGKRASGKSTVIGTLNVPTLLLTTRSEEHGVNSAKMFGKDNIQELLFDVNPDTQEPWDTEKEADKIYAWLIQILQMDLSQFKCVAFDGFSALDRVILYTKRVIDADKYTQSKIISEQHLKISSLLHSLYEKGFDVLATCAVSARLDDEGKETLEPAVRGSKVVADLSGEFPEVLVLGKVVIDQGGEEKEVRAFQFSGANIAKNGTILAFNKAGKPVSGGTKLVAVETRVSGTEPPDIMPADLKLIKKLKRGEEI